jgi:dsDNA-binding SOS-regulon protein
VLQVADNISKTILQYKEMSQLQQFAEAQSSTIIQLSKKLKKLEEERDHLKELLESSVPILKEEGKELSQKFLISSEEAICVMQLQKLRDFSSARELTLEEARRVEIFSKVLTTARNSPKVIELKTQNMTNEELLAIVEGTNDKSNR